MYCRPFWTSALLVAALSGGALSAAAPAEDDVEGARQWIERFAFVPPDVWEEGVCPPSGEPLPTFEVTPSRAGPQLVRVSLPFAPGTFPAELTLAIHAGSEVIAPDVRPLTYHPGKPRSVRRAIVAFVYPFPDTSPRRFVPVLRACEAEAGPQTAPTERFDGRIGSTRIVLDSDGATITRGPTTFRAVFEAPRRVGTTPGTVEIIAQGDACLWVRVLVPDRDWPRILDVRADALGTVALGGHLQRGVDGGVYETAPDIGWRIEGPAVVSLDVGDARQKIGDDEVVHSFADGVAAGAAFDGWQLDLPDAHLKRRGTFTARNEVDGGRVRYIRCRSDDNVPHQQLAWRAATVVLRDPQVAPLSPLLEPPHEVAIAPNAFDRIYHCGLLPDLEPWPTLRKASAYHIDSMADCYARGDDFGNISSMPDSGVYGMNRLNHAPPILESYYQTGDARLRRAALLWCQNYHDLSIWWQDGGTRYNNMARHHAEYRDDRSFMWRSKRSVHFCTKGIDTFFYAYEETGDPRMATALRWQVAYTNANVFVDRGECRNIGDVADYMRLYAFTGLPAHLEHAMRLFRELRTKLMDDNLFSQGGQPIVADPPFIDDDPMGTAHPFAKPYIIGYALAGLPALAERFPDEPRLADTIAAVASFQADAQDPVGGWRYPHPRSSTMLISQAMEHAAQLCRAAAFLESRGQPIDHLLAAIERTLQGRIQGWQKTGRFLAGLQGWERSTGFLKEDQTLHDLYSKPEERDASRDYTEGHISVGGAPPEGVVYWPEVLAFYLVRRPAERLFNTNKKLQAVLDRIQPTDRGYMPPSPDPAYVPYGVEVNLPIFRATLLDRLTFPMRWDPSGPLSFAEWRSLARAEVLECLEPLPPRAAFDSVVIAREDRGSYEARKIVLNISSDSRIPAYLLVPKGEGPFPAVVALHDHGARFSIGKEKMVRPIEPSQELRDDCTQWVQTCYGGRFIGDELARRGYVVFAIDALFWGERGRKGGPDYDAQQALAANLFQLGCAWPGIITADDIRSAEFVASLPEVDPSRIGAVGLSMGAHRAWLLAALSDRIRAAVAVCWMGTTEHLMVPGNNQVKGHSAYAFLVPGLRNHLDYADVASIACPKPLAIYDGRDDALFPLDGVESACAQMRRVWDSQDAADKLVTKTWPVGHVFNADMQAEAFDWLDGWLKHDNRTPPE